LYKEDLDASSISKEVATDEYHLFPKQPEHFDGHPRYFAVIEEARRHFSRWNSWTHAEWIENNFTILHDMCRLSGSPGKFEALVLLLLSYHLLSNYCRRKWASEVLRSAEMLDNNSINSETREKLSVALKRVLFSSFPMNKILKNHNSSVNGTLLSEDSQGLIKLANTFGAAPELAPELKINVKFLTRFLPMNRYTGGTAIVCEGEYRFQSAQHRVAVKTFTGKMGTSNHGMQSIHEAWSWRELSRLGNERIVRFFGLAENFPREGDISLISEWMPEGDLRSFARKHRGDDILLVNAVYQFLKVTYHCVDDSFSF
jgi:hypothetical protein